jgi:hypothetical protein
VTEKQETVARQVRFTSFACGRWLRGFFRGGADSSLGASLSSRIVDLGGGFGSRVVFHVWIFFFGIRGLYSVGPSVFLADQADCCFVSAQVHATVLLYNYFHRKQFPQLDFADAKRFAVSASLAAGELLLVYLNQVHDRGASGDEAGLSVTDKAIVDACGIAEALDATRDAPETITWPISKVAVLLIDKTWKRCLIEHGAVTQGVWSIPEKDVTTASGSTDLSSSEALPSEPFMLQQTAYSLVESKTGTVILLPFCIQVAVAQCLSFVLIESCWVLKLDLII